MEKRAKLVENLTGGLIFLVAFVTFFLSMAPTVSFWDCGEYIASSYSLGIAHPPGTPLYVILGRVFIVLLFWTEQVALRTNLLSVISAAFTAFFLHRIIVLAMKNWVSDLEETQKIITTNVAGFVGAAFGVFNYTFWFSAVETSVYVPAILTIVLNVYIVLIWANSKEANRDRYLILFAYLAFVGIGLHMMAMFALPPIFLYIMLVDKTKLKDWRLWGTALLLGTIMYSLGSFFFVAPALLVITAIFAFVPRDYSKIIAPFAGFFALFVLYRVLSDPGNPHHDGDLEKTIMIGLAIIVMSILNGITKDKNNEQKWKLAFCIVLVSLLGFSVNLFLPIRSSLEPMIDQNHPAVSWNNGRLEWDAFRGVLERRQYGTESMVRRMFHRRGALTTQFGIDNRMGYGGFHITQFFHFGESIYTDRTADRDNSILGETNFFKRAGILFLYLLPTFFMLWAWGYWFKKDRNRTALFVSLFVVTTIALVFYMNFADGTRAERIDYERWIAAGRPGQMPTVHREVRERDYFFTPGFMFLGVWMGLAAGALMHKAFSAKNPRIRRRLAPALAILFMASPALPISQNFSENDRSNDWIPYDYAYNLLMSLERNAILFTNGDNDTFPLWFLQEAEGIRRDVRVVNLSLANTSWYIRQLMRLDPKVPISFSLEDITNEVITHERNPFREPTEVLLRNADMRIVIPSARELPIMRVQDKLVVNIIDANAWRIPIYFSSTVSEDNMVGFGPFLRFEGMVYRVMPEPVSNEDFINFERTRLLLDQIYQFRGLGDNSTLMSETARRMMFNYSAVFIQFSHGLRMKINRMRQQIAQIDIQLALLGDDADEKLTAQRAELAEQIEIYVDEVINKMDRCVALMPWDTRSRGFRHEFLVEQGLYDLAKTRIEEALRIKPTNQHYLHWQADLERRRR